MKEKFLAGIGISPPRGVGIHAHCWRNISITRLSAEACFASPAPGRFADGAAGSCAGLGVFRLI